MNMPLFRQEAIDAGRQRLTGTVVAAVPPGTRVYTLIVSGVIFGLVLLLCFGSYSRRAQVRGVVAYAEGVARIAPPGAGKIEAVHVREGERVRAGAPLVTISLTQGRDAAGEGVASQLAELDRQYRELERQKELASALASNETASLRAQRQSIGQSLVSLQRQQSLMSEQIRLSEEQYRRSQRLAKAGAATKAELEEKRTAILTRALDHEALGERIIAQREALKTIEAQVSARGIGADQSGSQLSERMAALAEQRARLLRQDKLTLTASIAGVVGDLSVRPGQWVEGGSAIAVVVPDSTRFEVQLFAPSNAIGQVRPGQKVRLQFDAFPFQKYGAGSGMVTWVSSVPAEPAGLPQPPQGGEPMFRVRVALDRESASFRVPVDRFRAGMTLSANLILEDRSLWEVFFDPILRAMRA